jgi:hypothetical protein
LRQNDRIRRFGDQKKEADGEAGGHRDPSHKKNKPGPSIDNDYEHRLKQAIIPANPRPPAM